MHGPIDPTDERSPATGRGPGRHRSGGAAAAPVTLGLTVAALLSAFGVGAVLLPPTLIGAAGTTPPGAGTATEPRQAAPAPGGAPQAGPGAAGPTSSGAAPGTGTDSPGPGGVPGAAPGAAAPPGGVPGRVAPDRSAAGAAAGPDSAGRDAADAERNGSTADGKTGPSRNGPTGSGSAASGPAGGSSTGGGTTGGSTAGGDRARGGPVPRAGTPGAAQRTTPAGEEDFAAMEDEVVTLTNAERRRNGCTDLTPNPALRTAMRLHVQELARHDGLYLSHVSDDGRTFAERARQQGYTSPGAENVARGQSTPAAVVQGWMASPGHRANIVNCSLKAIGVGVARGDGTLVWGQIFGRS